jgi:hypothetical protein
MDNNSNNNQLWRSVMRKVLISALIFVFVSATAFASGGKGVQNRHGFLSDFNPEICTALSGAAKVHEYGARFTFTASGCTPGHVFTFWAFPDDFSFGLNCGGGIVLPNGTFKTICDVPMGNIEKDECEGCALVLFPGADLGDPRDVSFEIHMLTHNELVPERVLTQIRTEISCAEDLCELISILLFPAP